MQGIYAQSPARSNARGKLADVTEPLRSWRDGVANARGTTPLALATALLELAEREPVFAYRGAVVQALLDEAATLLDGCDQPDCNARLLLRIAELRMIAGDFDAAEQALQLMASTNIALQFFATVRHGRIELRRGNRDRARDELIAGVRTMPSLPEGDRLGRRATAEVVLAMAELHVDNGDSDDDGPMEAVDSLIAEIDGNDDWTDVEVTLRQLRATAHLARGRNDKVVNDLRAVVARTRAFAADEDEIEARIALAGILDTLPDEASRQEAERHVQIARDRSLERNLVGSLRTALIAQAGLLARRGRIAAAVDRCIELGRSALDGGDPIGYAGAAGLMSEIYANSGDLASALRTILEANAGLRASAGPGSNELFRPLLAAFRDRVGADHFAQLVADVQAASALADDLALRPS